MRSARFRRAIAAGVSPSLIDRGNGLNAEANGYGRHAVDNGYTVELCEPEPAWWQELRMLLKYQQQLDPAVLDQ